VRRGQLVARYGIFMQFTKFSRTGLIVSRLCLGTETFGKQTDEAESFRVFDKATDAGVNFIDTADVYPGGADLPEVGRSEEITGFWLKGKRSRFSLGTKAGGRMGSSPWDQGSSRKHLLDAIEASLRRLNTDFVDLYQLHMDERRAVRKRWPRRMLRRVARAVTSQASWRD
jgi:aryl-alcohol dehydrogenase-like predicted oxidoreductase